MEFLSPEGLRLDGRRPKELRKLHCEVGTLGEADGSATFDMGNTKVVAAVFGPRALPGSRSGGSEPARVQCELGIAAFSAGERRKRTQRDRRIQEIGAMLTAAMQATVLTDRLPGTLISIYIQVLAADGSLRAAALNAASLAVADAGIPMRDLVAGCMAAYIEEEGVLDLNHLEEAIGSSSQVFAAVHCNLGLVVVLQSDGRMKPEELESLAELAMAGCKAAGALIRDALFDNTCKLAVARGPVAF